MKKLIFSSILLLTLVFSYSFSLQSNAIKPIKTEINDASCKYGQCKGIAKSTGNRCKHCVSNAGDSYCWQHK